MKQRNGFIRSIKLKRDHVSGFDRYPFSIPAVRDLEELELHGKVTYLLGENGSGKSTLLEAIAVAADLNAEGGSRNLNFATQPTESELHEYLVLVRNPTRESTAYFLRAESFYNVATFIDELPSTAVEPYGGVSLHRQSHGESFLALLTHRFGPNGLYILDEPEAALSPQHSLSFLARVHDLVEQGSQFIIATHSPIILAYPDALIYQLDDSGIESVEYDEAEHVSLTRDFLNHRERYLRHLIE